MTQAPQFRRRKTALDRGIQPKFRRPSRAGSECCWLTQGFATLRCTLGYNPPPPPGLNRRLAGISEFRDRNQLVPATVLVLQQINSLTRNGTASVPYKVPNYSTHSGSGRSEALAMRAPSIQYLS